MGTHTDLKTHECGMRRVYCVHSSVYYDLLVDYTKGSLNEDNINNPTTNKTTDTFVSNMRKRKEGCWSKTRVQS